MAIVGLCPIAARSPEAKARTVKRLARPSMTVPGKAAAIGYITNDRIRVLSGEGHGKDLSWIESS